MNEVTMIELGAQRVELLPPRETLFLDFNVASVYASNSSLALNAVTENSAAVSGAWQTIFVVQ